MLLTNFEFQKNVTPSHVVEEKNGYVTPVNSLKPIGLYHFGYKCFAVVQLTLTVPLTNCKSFSVSVFCGENKVAEQTFSFQSEYTQGTSSLMFIVNASKNSDLYCNVYSPFISSDEAITVKCSTLQTYTEIYY